MSSLVVHETYYIAGPYGTLEDAAVYDGAPEGVILRVENSGGQLSLRISFGRRYLMYDCFKDFFNPCSFFCRAGKARVGVKPEFRIYLFHYLVHVRGGKVDLVDHRDNFQIVLHRHVKIRDSLCLNPLRGVDEQKYPFTGCERP